MDALDEDSVLAAPDFALNAKDVDSYEWQPEPGSYDEAAVSSHLCVSLAVCTGNEYRQ